MYLKDVLQAEAIRCILHGHLPLDVAADGCKSQGYKRLFRLSFLEGCSSQDCHEAVIAADAANVSYLYQGKGYKNRRMSIVSSSSAGVSTSENDTNG